MRFASFFSVYSALSYDFIVLRFKPSKLTLSSQSPQDREELKQSRHNTALPMSLIFLWDRAIFYILKFFEFLTGGSQKR